MSVTSLNKPIDGLVLDVSLYPSGSYLTAAYPAGTTTIGVEGVYDFDPDGGQLTINGVLYNYTTFDDIAQTITLTAGLTGAADNNDPVLVYPPSQEKWALVQTDPEADAIRARVPHSLADKFDLGIRTETERESVLVVVERTTWALFDVIAVPPVVDGAYLKNDSIPASAVGFTAADVGAQQIFEQSSMPVGASVDDIWIDTGNGNIMKRFDGTNWIAIDDTRIAQALTAAQGKNTIYKQSSAPTTGMVLNDLWIDSDDGKVYVWNGSSWVLSADQRIADVVSSNASKVTIFYQISPPASTDRVVNDLWIDTDDNQRVYRWTGSLWASTDIASYNYIISRATDLVTNGSGLLGSNQNFSGFTFVTDDAPPGAAGSFDSPPGVTATKVTDEFMPVDTSKVFKCSFQAKQKGATTGGYLYAGCAAYDTYKLQISPQHVMYIPNTLTTLAVALNPGDTTITLASSANWYGTASKPAGASVHLRSIIWWDYVDQGGKAWPELTYSRNWSGSSYWADGGITGNVITLSAPYSGPARPVGTKLSNGSSGGTYMYMTGVANIVVPKDWTVYSNTITGITQGGASPAFATGWPFGTAFTKLIWLVNRTSTGGSDTSSQHSIALVSFSDASAAADAAAAAAADAAAASALATLAKSTADGKITAFRQASAPTSTGRVVGDLWIDSDDGLLYVWTGSWTVSPDQRIAAVVASDATKITVFAQVSAPSTSGRTVGDVWIDTDDGNKVYTWSGSAWAVKTWGAAAIAASARDLGSITTYYQITAPASGMLSGDLWIDTDDGNKVYRYSGSAWQVAQDQGIGQAITAAAGAQATADGKVRTFAQASAPTGMLSTDDGDLWIDTDDGNKLYRWSGTAWVLLQDASIATAQAAANAAQTTANGKNKVTYSTSTPGTTANTAGDVWFQKDGSGNIIGQWFGLGGTSWGTAQITNSIIANLDAGKITVGTLSGITISGVTVTGSTLQTGTSGTRWVLSGGTNVIGELRAYYGTSSTPGGIQIIDTVELAPGLSISPPAGTDRPGIDMGSAITGSTTLIDFTADRLRHEGKELPRGRIGRDSRSTTSSTTTTGELIVLTTGSITFKAGRAYTIEVLLSLQSTVANDRVATKVYVNGVAAPIVVNTQLGSAATAITCSFTMPYDPGVDVTGTVQVKIFRSAGSGSVSCFASGGQNSTVSVRDDGDNI